MECSLEACELDSWMMSTVRRATCMVSRAPGSYKDQALLAKFGMRSQHITVLYLFRVERSKDGGVVDANVPLAFWEGDCPTHDVNLSGSEVLRSGRCNSG